MQHYYDKPNIITNNKQATNKITTNNCNKTNQNHNHPPAIQNKHQTKQNKRNQQILNIHKPTQVINQPNQANKHIKITQSNHPTKQNQTNILQNTQQHHNKHANTKLNNTKQQTNNQQTNNQIIKHK